MNKTPAAPAAVPVPAVMTRKEMRAALIGTKHVAERREVVLFNCTLEIQQPTLSSMLDARTEDSERDRTADMFIRYAYVPGTDELVFEAGDREDILNWPYTKDILKIQQAIMELTGIDIKDAEGVIKNDPLEES